MSLLSLSPAIASSMDAQGITGRPDRNYTDELQCPLRAWCLFFAGIFVLKKFCSACLICVKYKYRVHHHGAISESSGGVLKRCKERQVSMARAS
jgi:hypothetical protein